MNIRGKIFRSLLLAAFLACAVPASARQVLHYRTYHPKTGEEVNRFDCVIEENPSGGYQVRWTIDEGGSVTQQDCTLGEHFDTLGFREVNASQKTDYTGERKDNQILLRGQFKGENITKDLKIDDRPFYYNPKTGLVDFVRSGEKQTRFWGFNNRDPNVHPMKAVNEGPDRISLGGKQVDVIRVYWTLDDFRSAFFKRTYWFRASDGTYVRQKSYGGTFRELVSEEEQ